ncbi:MAG: penicillin-binding protein activator [Dokdonella sp.]|uniref:penicillin-binding protein activator n=1 Tax=Dokdonella sp. TaxID=2291710 RepID=UPI003264F984
MTLRRTLDLSMAHDPLRFGCSRSSARLVFAAMLGVALSGCATVSSGPDEAPLSADAERAEQLYAHGDLEQAANAFLALAQDTAGDTHAHYALRAAEALRERGDLDGAARALGDIKRRRLHGDEPVRLDLLDAEIALAHGNVAQAQGILAEMGDVPAALRIRAIELRARADLGAGDAFASAHARALLDRDLKGADREQNRRQLNDALATLDANALKTRVDALPADDVLRPWVEQALRGKGQPLARALPRPSHLVGTMQAGTDGALEAEGYASLKHVALLLPMGAQLAGVSQSIRDGFLTAYFSDDAARRPEVRLYDAGKTPGDALAAYNKAVADGADHVVGPLQREAVGELFHQPLPTRVLALNHPDTGEVPPAGSAEFGLLPDAEGAQVAEHMHDRGITRAAVITAGTDWAERAARAFRSQFEASGGLVVGESRLGDKDVNYSNAIVQATATLGSDPGAGVFISMRPQQARLLLPQLHVANVGAPVFATSHVYSGDANSSLDRDLDGVEFCDAPWVLGPIPGRPDRNQLSSQIASANGVGARLFAFGMDAYALLPYMDWLLAHPQAYLGGATGELTADTFGRIHRTVGWARFRDGSAQPADGALNAAPMQQ